MPDSAAGTTALKEPSDPARAQASTHTQTCTAGTHRVVQTHVHPHTAPACPPRCEQDPSNGRRPPAATGTDPPHPCRCPGSRSRRTPHERTPCAGTAQARTPSHVREDCPGNHVFWICQPCARDAAKKNTASAYVRAGDLAVDAMEIGCLGVERRGRRFFVLSHFSMGYLGLHF